MKRIFLYLCTILLAVSAAAQTHYPTKSNPETFRPLSPYTMSRTDIVIPQVNGYNVYKADLHIHTIYSDGHVSPEFRVREAWLDGIDVLAITEHLESRGLERKMVDYMKKYIKDDIEEPVNVRVVDEPADERGFYTDQNYSIMLAQKEAVKYGITIVPGTEISRQPDVAGHFNALFVEDNNTIYDPDPKQCLLNAKKQGALIMHNHPGWRRPDLNMIDFVKEVYAEGIIDGVEVMNGSAFYPKALDWVSQYDIFAASNTDSHQSTFERYAYNDQLRNMTLILAKDKSLESLKKAIKANRTLAYSFGVIAGKEQLLKDFFKSCISCEVIRVNKNGSRVVALKNNSSLPFIIRFKGDPLRIEPMGVITTTVAAGENVALTVESMWYSSTENPKIELKVK